ncbi:MAG: DNA repair protein RecO [Lachnospiraceae bacterium]|nr:DNA repair protein RecO [Lachnospiraceae bacterium]
MSDNNEITVTGMILASTPVGENDRRLVLLTRERGRITAFANGARRPTSHLLAATNPFSYGIFDLYEGRSSYTLRRADISEYFEKVASDLDCVLYGTFFLEVADYYGKEGLDESDRLLLLYVTMKAMAGKKIPLTLVKEIYLLRTTVLNGDWPDVFSCASCGKKEELTHFSFAKHGALCKDCAGKFGDAVPVSPDCLYALRFVESAEIGKLYSFVLSKPVEEEFTSIVEGYRKRYSGHTFKSEEFLQFPGVK